MRRILAVLTTVFVFTFLCAAQTGGSSDQSGAKTGADQTTKKTAHKGGAGSTLSGCLSGPNSEGAYELKKGKRTVEVGGLDDLSKHVGHEVKLHGSWAKSGSEIGEKEEKSEKTEKSEGKEEKGERHFKVTSIDHVSDTCPAAAAAKGEAGEHHHHKKGSSSTGEAGAASPSPTPKL